MSKEITFLIKVIDWQMYGTWKNPEQLRFAYTNKIPKLHSYSVKCIVRVNTSSDAIEIGQKKLS